MPKLKGVTSLLEVLTGKRNPASLPVEPNRPTDARKILVFLPPVFLPGWSVISFSSHSRRNVIRWLIVKGLLQSLSSEEKKALKLISIDQPEFVLLIVDFVTSTIKSKIRLEVGNQLRKHHSFEWVTQRFLNSFTPLIRTRRIWSEMKKLPPARFIGIGYRDQGSLGSGLRWQDQILLAGDENHTNFVREILQKAEVILPPPSLPEEAIQSPLPKAN